MIQPLLSKIREQTERLDHLIALVPSDALEWRPPSLSEARPLGHVLGHLLDCLAGFCATLYAAHPEPLANFLKLREAPVNHSCSVEEARRRIREYAARMEEGFALLDDADLARSIPTVFVPEGESLATLLLGNLEHLINHKQQLFLYLKMMGVAVGTGDLYHLRGNAT